MRNGPFSRLILHETRLPDPGPPVVAYTESLTFAHVADNLRESFRVIAAARPTGELRELRGVSIASAGVTFQMFNAAFLAAPVRTEAELSQRITIPSVHFNQRGLEWAYWVCDDFMQSAVRRRARQT